MDEATSLLSRGDDTSKPSSPPPRRESFHLSQELKILEEEKEAKKEDDNRRKGEEVKGKEKDDEMEEVLEDVDERQKGGRKEQYDQSKEKVVSGVSEDRLQPEDFEEDPTDLYYASLNEGELLGLNSELASERTALLLERGRQNRLAMSVTDQVNLEAQELLRLFGIPYVVGPMEAEAQCAYLDITGQTDGTITDDSDIWLFGGRRMYKNFFNQNKHVEFYSFDRISNHFGIGRDQLINIALLCGSDYTEGIQGVGPVRALEIMAEFPGTGSEGLRAFRTWWEKMKKREQVVGSKTRARLKNLKLPNGFPSETVVRAYLSPTVDESTESFAWKMPELDVLRDFAKLRFGWSREKSDQSLVPMMKQLTQRKNQGRIHAYFQPESFVQSAKIRSDRLKKALSLVKNSQGGDEEREEEEDEMSGDIETKRMRKAQGGKGRVVGESGKGSEKRKKQGGKGRHEEEEEEDGDDSDVSFGYNAKTESAIKNSCLDLMVGGTVSDEVWPDHEQSSAFQVNTKNVFCHGDISRSTQSPVASSQLGVQQIKGDKQGPDCANGNYGVTRSCPKTELPLVAQCSNPDLPELWPEAGSVTLKDNTSPAGCNIFADRSRKSNINGTAKGAPPSSAPNAPRGGPTPSSAPRGTSTTSSQKEIVRLESLCEARTKELSQARMQLRATTQAFDAMSVVVNYCCVELDAFECPTLALKLETVQRQLKDCLTQIADLTSEKDALDKNLSEISQQKEEASKLEQEARHKAQADREDHEKVQKDMEDTHNAALTAQRDELTQQHNEAVKKLHDFHDKQIDLQKQAFDRQLLDVKNENKMEINGIRISQLEEIQELRNKHDTQMEELHKQHRNKLEDITHRFESIKLTLSEKVESLRGECDDLRHRARSSEEALQRDADVKVQMALAPFLSLPKEIESLKTVVEMRNEEISKLRSRNMDLEKQLEEIPIARDKIISLQQKVENLEAIINIKTDHEKQLHEKCQILMRKYDKESRANKRLSMDYEQVMWRMSQSSEFGSSESLSKRQVSRSPARSETTSPDPRHRTLSPNYHGPNGDVVMRVKKRSSKSLCETDRKLRSRSATFVVEKDEKLVESRSPSSSPQVKQKRWKRISQGEEDASENSSDNLDAANERARMCVSAGPEILSQYTSGHLGDGDVCEESDMPSLGNTMDSNLASSGEMINSYARSISGVSDSGVYDSMTRSEMLNSSIVSTDSEWVASANVSQMLDSTNEDFDGSPDGCSEQDRTVVHNVRSYSRSRGDSDTEGSARHTYQFQVSIPGSTGEPSADNVFEDQESGSLGSCSLSLENTTDGAPSVSNSRLTSVSEDFSCHDIACDTTVSLPLGGAAQDDRTPSRDVSSDNLSGLPRSETVVEKCIGEMGGAQCNSSGEGRATQDDVHQEN
ncbi:uncharacterized protein LOC101859887 [Aplysia californica]|uniref:Uncharacterized protein LOC101859887 n=1 Tax=Aplysia californica TaxID=6500 RepID=A0ABM1A9D3_APLCA|nr:uncharacterized protein LOC101859887 [Aplysia californica]